MKKKKVKAKKANPKRDAGSGAGKSSKRKSKSTVRTGVNKRGAKTGAPKATTKKKSRSLRRRRAVAPVNSPTPLTTTTFRLPIDLLAMLRSAATDRRNRLAEPYTMGGIVIEALQRWLDGRR